MKKNIEIQKKKLHSIVILITIFILRISTIFMVLPILPIYAISLKGAHEYLIGIAIGIYGIMQIFFQLPFGIISDKIGRKPAIIIGLITFFIGSSIIATSNKIHELIIGRALQGSSAIGSVLLTLLLESVHNKNQTKVMALIGMLFGITFISSIIIGPFIVNKLGLRELFQIITGISAISILLTYFLLPKEKYSDKYYKKISMIDILKNIKLIITNLELLKLNFNNFCLHTILTLNFMIWPKIITNLGYTYNVHYKIYAIVIGVSILFLFPYIFYLNKKYIKKVLSYAIKILFLSELIMYIFIQNGWLFLLGIQIFFIAFNLIESILPYLINKNAPEQYKGTSMSIYSINQFLGIGIGGIIGGLLLEIQGVGSVLLFSIIIAILNLIINNKILILK